MAVESWTHQPLPSKPKATVIQCKLAKLSLFWAYTSNPIQPSHLKIIINNKLWPLQQVCAYTHLSVYILGLWTISLHTSKPTGSLDTSKNFTFMEHSPGSFTRMLNNCSSQDPENRNYTPSATPPHQFTSASSSQHGQYLHPMYAQNMYPFPPPHTSGFHAAHGVYGGGSYGHSSSAAAGFTGIDPTC